MKVRKAYGKRTFSFFFHIHGVAQAGQASPQETYGYIRVSSTDQNESRQRIALEQQGISSDHIFMDKMCSGSKLIVRSILQKSRCANSGKIKSSFAEKICLLNGFHASQYKIEALSDQV